jgi:hypothetical protein
MTYGDENATIKPLNPWPRPIIGAILAKSTVKAYSSTGWESCHESHLPIPSRSRDGEGGL